jgi:hypothetical protein
VDFCILPQSVGGSGFHSFWHAPHPPDYATGGSLYETTITQINAFLAAEVGNTIDLVILQNGEQETGDAGLNLGYYGGSYGLTDKQAYTRYVTEMIADMAARVTGGRTWPFLIGSVPPDLTYGPETIGPSACGHDHHGSQYIPIFEAQKEMPAYVTNSGYIDALYPTKAMYHTGVKTQGSDTTTTGPAPDYTVTFVPDGLPDIIVNGSQYFIHYSQAAFYLIAHRAFKQYMRLKGYGTPITLAYTAAVVVTPEAPSLDLATASDTGSSSTDDITTDTTPDIIVTFVTTVLEGDIIRLRDGVTELVAHTITAGEIGSLSLALGLSPLSGGAHSLTARHERGAGLSPYSAVLTLTVDVTGPTITTPATANVNEGVALAIALTADEAVTWTLTSGAADFEISGTTLRWLGNGTKTFTGVVDAYAAQVTATDAASNATNKNITVTVLDVVVGGTTRSFGAEGVGVTVTIGGREFGAEGLGIVES